MNLWINNFNIPKFEDQPLINDWGSNDKRVPIYDCFRAIICKELPLIRRIYIGNPGTRLARWFPKFCHTGLYYENDLGRGQRIKNSFLFQRIIGNLPGCDCSLAADDPPNFHSLNDITIFDYDIPNFPWKRKQEEGYPWLLKEPENFVEVIRTFIQKNKGIIHIGLQLDRGRNGRTHEFCREVFAGLWTTGWLCKIYQFEDFISRGAYMVNYISVLTKR